MDDTNRTKLIEALRRTIESTATAMECVALDHDERAASSMSVSLMYLGEAIGLLIDNREIAGNLAVMASDATDRVYPERHLAWSADEVLS